MGILAAQISEKILLVASWVEGSTPNYTTALQKTFGGGGWGRYS
jgi:hypothetical protein